MIICSECGYSNTDSNEKCSNCGADLSREAKREKKKSVNYKAISFILIGCFAVSLIAILTMAMSNSELKTEIDNLQRNKQNLESELSKYKEKYDNLANSEEYRAFLNYSGSMADLEQEKQDLENKISVLENEMEIFQKEYNDLSKEELSFPAGEFICGVDFIPGRYAIYDGKSNFFVYSGDSTDVNIIFGDDPDYEVSEYVHFFKDGEKIESHSSFKMRMVE